LQDFLFRLYWMYSSFYRKGQGGPFGFFCLKDINEMKKKSLFVCVKYLKPTNRRFPNE